MSKFCWIQICHHFPTTVFTKKYACFIMFHRWLTYNIIKIQSGWWFEPFWKIWKSVRMIIPNIWKNKIHVPNHQPAVNLHFPDLNWIIPHVPRSSPPAVSLDRMRPTGGSRSWARSQRRGRSRLLVETKKRGYLKDILWRCFSVYNTHTYIHYITLHNLT